MIVALLFAAASIAAPLPKLTIARDSVTVSGISSGAFMATQLGVAFSSRIHGVGSVAGGIYYCARNMLPSTAICMNLPGALSEKIYIRDAIRLAKEKKIDPVSNLKNSYFYLFHSEADATVRFPALDKLEAFFKAFTPKERIRVETVKDASHAFPTLDYGNRCNQTGAPFLTNCKRDVAGEILGRLYPNLRAPNPASDATGVMVEFDQTKYAPEGANMLSKGHAYIPAACLKGDSCRLHFALHGCKMNSEFADDQFRAHAGYNRWADANNIVVIYPESDKAIMNPNGCWDWFGFTGSDYAFKSGKQMQFFSKIMDQFGIR